MTAKSFSPSGIILDKPGHYRFLENVELNINTEGAAAVIVRSHDVTIDLCDRTLQLTQAAYDAFENVSAIVVESGYNNFTLQNGHIRRFSDQGVIVVTDNYLPTDHHGIIIKNVTVGNIGKIETQTPLDIFTRAGININGSTDVVIEDCDAFDVKAFDDSEGISCNYCDHIKIDNCTGHDNQSNELGGYCIGIGLYAFTTASITRSRALRNSGRQVYAFSPFIGTSIVMDRCLSHYNRGFGPAAEDLSGGFCGAFTVDTVNSATLTYCEADYNLTEANSIDNANRNFCTGIQFANGTAGTIDHCKASFNSTASSEQLTGGGCVGVDINRVDGVTVTNCFAQGNTMFNLAETGTFFGFAVGFDSDFSSNVVFENCTAIANNPQPGSSTDPKACAGFYASIFPEGGPFSNIIFRNCKSTNHQVETDGILVAGFLIGEDVGSTILTYPEAVVIDNCIAENNRNTSEGSEEFGLGIGLMEGSNACVVSGNTLSRNGVGIYVNTLRDDATLLAGNMVVKNKLIGNLVAGIVNLSETTSYAKNYAHRNGSPVNNYVDLPDGTPIRTWNLGSPPNSVNNNGILDPLDNIDIQ